MTQQVGLYLAGSLMRSYPSDAAGYKEAVDDLIMSCEETGMQHELKYVDEPMSKAAALDLLNTIEIVDSDSDGESVFHIHIQDTPINRNKLMQIGVTLDEFYLHDGEIDISPFAFDRTDAEFFDGTRFLNAQQNEERLASLDVL